METNTSSAYTNYLVTNATKQDSLADLVAWKFVCKSLSYYQSYGDNPPLDCIITRNNCYLNGAAQVNCLNIIATSYMNLF